MTSAEAVLERVQGARPAAATDAGDPLRRHAFLSHALAGGRTLVEVRDAAGHSNVNITSAYLHALVDDEPEVGRLFGTE